MTQHLSLLRFTEEGLKTVEQSAERAAKFRDAVTASGGKVNLQFWMTGQWDGCVVFEAPDEQTAASLVLALAKEGNVCTQTMRLYDEQEFKSILAKV